jgi:hypothetical protein
VPESRPAVELFPRSGHAEIDRLRAELEELTGKPVVLNTLDPQG